MGKTLKVKISTESISKAIADVNTYKQSIVSKTELFRKRVAEELRDRIQQAFNSSIAEDYIGESAKMSDIQVYITHEGNVSVIYTEDENAIWIEFGAGVYHNTSAGTSPHPKGRSYGFLIGTYGMGLGSRKIWGYSDENGHHVTHGTPATMPMYLTAVRIVHEIHSMAKEVFG